MRWNTQYSLEKVRRNHEKSFEKMRRSLKLLLFSCLMKLPDFVILQPFHIAMKRQHFEDFEKNAVLNFEEIEKNHIKNFEETGIYSIFAMLE